MQYAATTMGPAKCKGPPDRQGRGPQDDKTILDAGRVKASLHLSGRSFERTCRIVKNCEEAGAPLLADFARSGVSADSFTAAALRLVWPKADPYAAPR